MASKVKVQWEEPPEARRGDGKYVEFFEALRVQPGKFARWPGPASSANAIKAGKYVGAEEGEFEVVTRTVDGELCAWVAYTA